MRIRLDASNCLALLAVLTHVAGCATTAPGPGLAEERGTPAISDQPEPSHADAPPTAIRDALLPPLALPVDGRVEPVGATRFDVAVHDAPARGFFMNLVEGTPYDIVVHPNVDGRLSLSLRNVTVPQILDAIREVYGYGYRETDSGFQILPAELQSRIFEIDYVHVLRTGSSRTRVSSGQLTEAGGSSTSFANGGPATTTGNSGGNVVESSTVTTASGADVWLELRDSLEVIVGGGPGRSVVITPQAGIAVIRAMPDELRRVEEFLRGVQGNLERQVILDARILEVELRDGFRAGINWAALIEFGSKSILFGQTGGGTFFDDAVSEIGGNMGDLDPNNFVPVRNAETSAFGGVFSAVLDLNKFKGFIELLETQGDVHVLSSPRVSTVNNQKAVIKVGQDEFFVTDVSTTTVTGTATTTTPNVTLTPFFSGIALDVLPQISSEGDVILHVHPSISLVVDQTKSITVGEDQLTLPLALSTIRESDSIVRARSGQTVVIGGLMQERESARHASAPWISKIPYVGKLFGQHANSTVKSELVILIQPTVVGDDTGNDEVEQTRHRMEQERYAPVARRLLGNDGWSSAP